MPAVIPPLPATKLSMRSALLTALCTLLLLAAGWLVYLGSSNLHRPRIVEPEDGPAPLSSYPAEQVATVRLYVDILREADTILAAEDGSVEERITRLNDLCPRMQALAESLHGMSDYRRDDLRESLGCGWEKLPALKATLDHHFATLGDAPAEGDDRRLTEATLRLMGSDWYGKLPIHVTPEETAQGLMQHLEALQAQLQRPNQKAADRLEALRLGYDHLNTLRLPLQWGEDEGKAYCRDVRTQLRSMPGALEKLDRFFAFIRPHPYAMESVRSYLEMRIVETQQDYYRLLRDIMLHELTGLAAEERRELESLAAFLRVQEGDCLILCGMVKELAWRGEGHDYEISLTLAEKNNTSNTPERLVFDLAEGGRAFQAIIEEAVLLRLSASALNLAEGRVEGKLRLAQLRKLHGGTVALQHVFEQYPELRERVHFTLPQPASADTPQP